MLMYMYEDCMESSSSGTNSDLPTAAETKETLSVPFFCLPPVSVDFDNVVGGKVVVVTGGRKEVKG